MHMRKLFQFLFF